MIKPRRLLLVLVACLAIGGAAGLAMLYRGAEVTLEKLKLSPLDNNTWAAVQAQLEYERLRATLRAIRLGDATVTRDTLDLRLDIINSRVGVLSAGDVRKVLEPLPSYESVLESMRAALERADAIAHADGDAPLHEIARRLDDLLEPLDSTIKRFTVEVVQSSAMMRGQHEVELADVLQNLRITSLLVGLAFLAVTLLLLRQNRRLVESAHQARKMLHELTEANAAKARFLANMSHELRTPLNAVLGFADMMRQQMLGPLPKTYAGYVQDIHASGEHLLGLIEDILNMARIDAGHAELRFEWTDLKGIVDAAVLVTRPQAERGGVRLELDVAAAIEVDADARALRQVLVNLIGNAVKFTPRDGHVMCRAAIEPNGDLAIVVEDTGMGIPPEDIPRVTQPFHRGANVTSAAVGGVGLGLAISRTLVELHDGRMEITSTLGKGTRVALVLPAARVGESVTEMLRASA